MQPTRFIFTEAEYDFLKNIKHDFSVILNRDYDEDKISKEEIIDMREALFYLFQAYRDDTRLFLNKMKEAYEDNDDVR